MSQEAPYTAEQVKLLREHTGLGLMDCKRAFDLAQGPDFGGDVVLAAAYVDRNKLAIFIKGDRYAAMLRRAAPFAEDLRARIPALDATFPKPVGR